MFEQNIASIRDGLRALEELEALYSQRAADLREYENRYMLMRTSASGHSFYYTRVRTPADALSPAGKYVEKYLGTEAADEVRLIKEAHYNASLLQAVRHNIKTFRAFLNDSHPLAPDFINAALPKAYRCDGAKRISRDEKAALWKSAGEARKADVPAPYPEFLKFKASDGTLVRSKSELIIYNLLEMLGVTFVYELPLSVGDATFHPDFTILSEMDSETAIIIEHQGVMSDARYRERFADRVYRYLQAGYVQGINIFYTFDFADGSFDSSTIVDIVLNHIKGR